MVVVGRILRPLMEPIIVAAVIFDVVVVAVGFLMATYDGRGSAAVPPIALTSLASKPSPSAATLSGGVEAADGVLGASENGVDATQAAVNSKEDLLEAEKSGREERREVSSWSSEAVLSGRGRG